MTQCPKCGKDIAAVIIRRPAYNDTIWFIKDNSLTMLHNRHEPDRDERVIICPECEQEVLEYFQDIKHFLNGTMP